MSFILGDCMPLAKAGLRLLSWMSVVLVDVCDHGFVAVQMALVTAVVKRD